MAALYFLKVRPRKKQTNAFFLWQQVYEEKSSSAFFRRLRDLWSLLFMLLALLLISLALANPVFEQTDSRDLIIVLDSSASMQSQEAGTAQLERAKKEAIDIIRALNGTRQAAVASVSNELTFHSHLSSHPRELIDAVNAIPSTELPLSESALKQLGETISAEDSPYRIVFISDGNYRAEAVPEAVEVLNLECADVENVGIIAADFQWLPGRNQVASVYIRVFNSGAEEVAVDLELEHVESGRLAKLMPLVIPADDELELIFEVEAAVAGMWKAQLMHDDALALDNSVVLGLNPSEPVKVSIQAENTWFFKNCVQAFRRAGGALAIAQSDAGADMNLVEGGLSQLSRQTLLFKPAGTSPLWKSLGGPVSVQIAKVEVEEHPFLKHIDVDSIQFAGAREVELPVGAVVLVASDQGVPLLYTVRDQGHAAIVANFDPNDSDFFLSPWFPVMVHAASIYLADDPFDFGAVVATGSRLRLSSQADFAGSLVTPTGVAISLAGLRGIELTEIGAHELIYGDTRRFVGAGLLSKEETQLQVKSSERIESLAAGWPVGWLLLLIAFILLITECWLYHRRKLG